MESKNMLQELQEEVTKLAKVIDDLKHRKKPLYNQQCIGSMGTECMNMKLLSTNPDEFDVPRMQDIMCSMMRAYSFATALPQWGGKATDCLDEQLTAVLTIAVKIK
jgi:hypothetical protein